MQKEKEVIDMEHEAISTEIEPPHSKLKLPIIIGGIILLLIGGLVGWYFSKSSQKKNEEVGQPTPTVAQTDTQSSEIKTNKEIDLYNIGLYLPESWTLKEVNRRPEPTPLAEGLPMRGHDCADYEITNIPQTLVLTIQPSCGYSDGGAEELTIPYVTVKKYSDGDIIARTHSSVNQKYSYFNAGYADISDSTGDHKVLMGGGVVSIGANGERHEGPSLLFLSISATYTGPEVAKERELSLADKVVASLTVTKYIPPSPTGTSSVKTFKNSRYQFDYPADWVAIEDNGSVSIYDAEGAKNPGPNSLINIFEYANLGKFTFEDPVGKKEETGDKIFVTKQADVIVDSITSMRLSTEVLPGSATDASPGLSTIVPFNSTYTFINVRSTDIKIVSAYEQMLSTFHFIK